jgi:hypothetical protein
MKLASCLFIFLTNTTTFEVTALRPFLVVEDGPTPEALQVIVTRDPHHTMNHMYVSYDGSNLVMRGLSFQTRFESTAHMINDAFQLILTQKKSVRHFTNLSVSIDDVGAGPVCPDWAYCPVPDCRSTKAIPDFSFYKWTEAGLIPDYTTIVLSLGSISTEHALLNKCGWAGNPETNAIRKAFISKADKSLFEIFTPASTTGTQGRLSMADEVKKWTCFVDLPGEGYSGRVPMLLWSGRPLLLVERSKEHPLDNVFYAAKLQPWFHYIPVQADLSDLNEKAAMVLSEGGNATVIAQNALEFARLHLSYDAAVREIAEHFLSL